MAEKEINLNNYIDLTDETVDLAAYKIVINSYDCDLLGPNGELYKGFILAKSPSGKAFTVVDTSFQRSAKDDRYPARLTFRRTNDQLEDKPINKGHRYQRISMEDGADGYRQFWKMMAFLSQYEKIIDDAKMFDAFQLVSRGSVVRSLKEKAQGDQKQELIDYIEESDVTIDDMADALVHKARVEDLKEFKKLLDNENNYTEEYRTQYVSEIKGAGNEPIWHHFLSNHKWIFGLGLDLRFMHDFVDEAAVGNPDTSGSGNPNADMLGWSDYTATVEIKTPDAKFFTESKRATGRTNTWSFTPDFIDGISQVLSQKDDWQSSHANKTVTQEIDGVKHALNTTAIRTVDPKAIFIYGHKGKEIPVDSSVVDVLTKRDTLERFTRNNRNVSIISFDELYARAYHIVHGELPTSEHMASTTDVLDELDDWF